MTRLHSPFSPSSCSDLLRLAAQQGDVVLVFQCLSETLGLEAILLPGSDWVFLRSYCFGNPDSDPKSQQELDPSDVPDSQQSDPPDTFDQPPIDVDLAGLGVRPSRVACRLWVLPLARLSSFLGAVGFARAFGSGWNRVVCHSPG